MSLRCSLLGHDYGDAEIEREREEEGTEVVVTVREFKECDRCGERSTVSENKEVTAIETPTTADAGGEGAGTSGAGGNASSPTGGQASGQSDVTMGGQSDTSAGGQPAGATDGQSANSAGSQSGVGSTAPSVDSEFEHPQSAEEDDGVILEDDDDEETDDDREPGQWPDEDANRSSDDRKPGAWPEVGREDEGYDAEPSDGGNADVQFGGGLTPESTADTTADDEAEFVNAEGDTLQSQSSTSGNRNELSSGFTAGSSAPSAASPSDDSDDLDAEFVCPECNFRAEVNNSSMRAGDICPECRKGYIAKE